MNTSTESLFSGLPGEEFAHAGLEDRAAGRESVAALLMEIAAPRLRTIGCGGPVGRELDAELRLYRLLVRMHGDDAYGQYNALLRRLVSFERALDHRLRQRTVATALMPTSLPANRP